MGLIAIAVGYSEGNRTLDGEFTSSYWGHTDPGNQRRNQGSFSYQHRAASPKEADLRQLTKLQELLPTYRLAADAAGLDPNNAFLFCSFCDLFTQSEAAATLAGGLLAQFISLAKMGLSASSMIDARIKSYYDPRTGEVDAPGFGNDSQRLAVDQRRRTEAIVEVLRQRL